MTPTDETPDATSPTWASAVTAKPNSELAPTGFADLDTLTGGGLRPGTLTVIASRPGMGRTTLLHDICRHNAIRNSRATMLTTLEESREDVVTRFLSAETRVPRHQLLAGTIDKAAWERLSQQMKAMEGAPLVIDAPPSTTAADIAGKATELVAQHGTRLIAIDGIQDIQPERRNDLREREVGDVVRDLKALARELQVPVVATAHLNRSPEQRIDKRPRLDDLRESGAITFSADLLVLLHREDYYDRESPRAGEADLIIAKHRYGPTAVLTVGFQGHYSRFIDISSDDIRPPRPTRPGAGFSDLFGAGSEGVS
ncbi:DnaB-like helicase C-terminal domain-containing protein [Nonomuraea sp. NPDC026600]|uniref:DnaB-like helicase C-terminal domain-containing protein n=1 Tax=Nonomuraea sp. NPDC026600 TaxID=3155363 RepID=UPI0033E08742